MIDKILSDVLAHPTDRILPIVNQGIDEPHVVNTWNSHVNTFVAGKLLIPVGGMTRTEEKISKNNKVKLTISNTEVQGTTYKGTGYLIKGTARFIKEGSAFDRMKAKFMWARAVLEVLVESVEQTD